MGADHDINIPFTRGLAGPKDYHLGGFVMKITSVQDNSVLTPLKRR